MKINTLLLTVALALFVPAFAHGQSATANEVVGSGGGDAASTNFGTRGTVGQTAAGETESESYGHQAGYWYGPVTIVSGIRDDNVRTPRVNRLHQNYPNPFNPTTTIQFEIAERTRVRIRVYNAAGQMVAQLLDEVRGPGLHTLTFNVGRIASGVYFYRIEAGPFVDTKKMVLLK